MLDKDPKKMAAGVLHRAFSGKMTPSSNFSAPKVGNQYESKLFGSPGSDSNFPAPREEVQSYANGGEVEEGKLVAAEEMLSAFQDRDAKKLAMALHNFVEQCYIEESMEPEMGE